MSVQPFHLGKYLDEEAFRFNERKNTDSGRFTTVLGQATGRRLTYKKLTGKTLAGSARRRGSAMEKKKTKDTPPPRMSEEYGRFKNLLRQLVAVSRKEVEEKLEEYKERRAVEKADAEREK